MTEHLVMKWTPHGNKAEQLINKASEHLDLRKKRLQNDERNRRILASILAQRLGNFTVKMSVIDKGDREALRGVLEGLTGPILTRSSGSAAYALRDEYRSSEAKFSTIKSTTSEGRQPPSITTAFGTIYNDGSHSEVPFEHIKLFGFVKPSLARIVAPHTHWSIFLGDKPKPSTNWREIAETETVHPEHDKVMHLAVREGLMRGVPMTRYGHDSFITGNPNATIFALDNAITRYSGRAGQRPLIEITDSYQRKHIRWGGKA